MLIDLQQARTDWLMERATAARLVYRRADEPWIAYLWRQLLGVMAEVELVRRDRWPAMFAGQDDREERLAAALNEARAYGLPVEVTP